MSLNSSKTNFVIGGSGFIGYTIVTQLLNAGYRCGSWREGCASRQSVLGALFEVFSIPDIVGDDLAPFLKAPIPGRASAAAIYRIAEQGGLHIAGPEALNAAVKRLIVTRSVVTWPATGSFYGIDIAAVGTKRLPIISPDQSFDKTAIEILAAERADLKDRLADPADAPVWPTYTLPAKREDIEKVIGFKADSYTYPSWRRWIV
ncbi:hypothetical protein CPB85DRAFT_1433492 [Mucidula mucida]|nr:hypothetical protein CPB85DRAFT_1433492 [Mucidula mucida]